MAYYTALIAQWGTLSGTTAVKLAAINALTVTGTIPTTFSTTGPQLLNCIKWSEFNALTAQQQSNLMALCNNPGPVTGGSAQVSLIAAGMFLAYFGVQSQTITNLTALAQATVQPWWQANGYPGIFNNNDLIAAGLS